MVIVVGSTENAISTASCRLMVVVEFVPLKRRSKLTAPMLVVVVVVAVAVACL